MKVFNFMGALVRLPSTLVSLYHEARLEVERDFFLKLILTDFSFSDPRLKKLPVPLLKNFCFSLKDVFYHNGYRYIYREGDSFCVFVNDYVCYKGIDRKNPSTHIEITSYQICLYILEHFEGLHEKDKQDEKKKEAFYKKLRSI